MFQSYFFDLHKIHSQWNTCTIKSIVNAKLITPTEYLSELEIPLVIWLTN